MSAQGEIYNNLFEESQCAQLKTLLNKRNLLHWRLLHEMLQDGPARQLAMALQNENAISINRCQESVPVPETDVTEYRINKCRRTLAYWESQDVIAAANTDAFEIRFWSMQKLKEVVVAITGEGSKESDAASTGSCASHVHV
jgi:hypothetical protein